jgi:O-antigen/teichoic acid export membrane protein
MLQKLKISNLDKQVFLSLIFKGISIVINFLLIPLSIRALNTESYGLWLTITSIFGWFTFMDFGLTNGLVVKLTHSLGKGDYLHCKVMNSTVYISLFIISISLSIIFILVNLFLDWPLILNTKELTGQQLQIIVMIVFIGFFFTFFLKPIESVSIANQKPGISSLINPLSNLIILVLLWLLINFKFSLNLTTFCLVYAVITPLVYLLANLILYNGKFRQLAPKLSFFNKKEFKRIFSLGWNFFLIQISLLILFQTSNILITQFWGPEEVTNFNLVYKYFSIIYMLFTILIAPYMAAHGAAYSEGNLQYVRKNVKKTMMIWYLIMALGIILLILHRLLFSIWVGADLIPELPLAIMALVYFTLITFGGVYNMVINGTGKIKLQTLCNVISAILFIPCTLILVKGFGMGLEAIFISMVLVNFYHPIIAPLQYHKLINKNASGIWNR